MQQGITWILKQYLEQQIKTFLDKITLTLALNLHGNEKIARNNIFCFSLLKSLSSLQPPCAPQT